MKKKHWERDCNKQDFNLLIQSGQGMVNSATGFKS